MTSIHAFQELRARYLPEIEKLISESLSKKEQSRVRNCAEMTSYHFQTGGKRLRAIIPLYVYQTLNHDPSDVVPLGAAIEMIHNATLVHDDLQDGDELRRGRPTVWKRFSSEQAINCGDAMFQFAFPLLLTLNVSPDRLLKLMDRAAESTLNVIEGQAQEFLMKDELYPSVDRYVGVIRGKTSGLFALPVVGAMEALGLDKNICRAVEKASMDLGMLFQIQDDVLDVYGAKGREKPATDVAEGKISFLVAHVNDTARNGDKETLSKILRKPRLQTTDGDIQEAIAIFERNDAKGAALGRIRKICEAIDRESSLNSCEPIRHVLHDLGGIFLEPLNGIV